MSITINTNLSSLIVQNALTNATSDLNRAIERMTTGSKINSAKDNAADYSVVTSMSTKLSAYRIAEDNASSGLDMVSTATSTLDLMNNQLSRLRSLAVEAQNGTYGTQSIAALQSESNSIIKNLNQLMTSAEYNGKKLFEEVAPPEGFNQSNMPVVQESGFIGDITPVDTSSMKTLTQAVSEGKAIKGGTWAIGSVEDLVKLAELTNTTTDNTTGTTFVLSQDIDLSGIDNWTPIGDYSTNYKYQFKGTFNGNGHVIRNLKIDNPSKTEQGLFGRTGSGSTIKNLGVENVDVKGDGFVGGLAGTVDGTITNCYSTGNVSGNTDVGGLAGNGNTITNCYSTCNVNGNTDVGGLAGIASATFTNCYATGNVSGSSEVGGLVGNTYVYGCSITSCYATGNVNGSSNVGGLVGAAWYDVIISSSYSTGNVSGNTDVGGLVGYCSNNVSINFCYSTGDVVGTSDVGGLVGSYQITSGSDNMTNSISYSKVSGQDRVGSFIGSVINTDDGSSFGTLTITNCKALPQNMPAISGCYMRKWDSTAHKYIYTQNTHGLDDMLAVIGDAQYQETSLQVGIDGSQNSVITTEMGFKKNVLVGLSGLRINDSNAISTIDAIISDITSKETELGAVENRLESVLESINVQYENLVSTRSVIKDADVAEESSAYIRAQILQNASATLLATANQSSSIALTIIGGL